MWNGEVDMEIERDGADGGREIEMETDMNRESSNGSRNGNGNGIWSGKMRIFSIFFPGLTLYCQTHTSQKCDTFVLYNRMISLQSKKTPSKKKNASIFVSRLGIIYFKGST